jgi:uncharacterized membrane protein YraQ (UPF0718 family)
LLGVATSSAQLFRQMGGTVGVAILGTIMNGLMGQKLHEITRLTEQLPERVEDQIGELTNPQVLMDHERLARIQQSIPEQTQGVFTQLIGELRDALGYALNGAFLAAACVLFLAFILTLFLKELELKTTNK